MLKSIQFIWLVQSSIVCSNLALEIVAGDAYTYSSFNLTRTSRICADPGDIPHANRRPEVKYGVFYHYGTPLHYVCEPDYKLVGGNGKVVCGLNGGWEPSLLPSCHLIVCPLPAVPHGYILSYNTEFLPKMSVKVYCHDGYRLLNKFVSILECQNDSMWTGHNGAFTQELPECVESTCPPLPEVPHATLVYKGVRGQDHGFKEGSVAQYSCHQGFLINGTTKASKIVESHCHNGVWSGNQNLECKLVGCSPPPLIANGKREIPFEEGLLIRQQTGVNYPVGVTVKYWCNSGYQLMAATQSYTCMPDGRWLPAQTPTCEKLDFELPDYSITCPKPPSVQFGSTLGIQNHYCPLSTVSYICDEGYRLVGPSQLHCDSDGHWQPAAAPTCDIILDKPLLDWGSYERTSPANKEPRSGDSTSENESQTVSLVTAGCVLGLLSIILILAVAYQKRRCSRRYNHVQLQQPINSAASNGSNAHLSQYQDQDRVSLIAFADGAHLTLPSYEESIRQRNPMAFGVSASNANPSGNRSTGRYSRFAVHRSSNHDQASTGANRQSSHSGYGRSSSVADSLGSNDTVTPSEVSTTVTVDTLSSNASQTASAASTRAFYGSLASFDTTGSGSILNIEGVPLLEEGDSEKDPIAMAENQLHHQEVV